ncbi:MAG: TRAP transporter fused permease subunit [Deltaproteobacteria bacterium]|nr:TRAP transporter fused permease subunit [Deltaproteobacteria bacterium]
MDQEIQDVKKGETTDTRYRALNKPFRIVFYFFSVLAVFISIEFFFSLGIGGYNLSNWQYYYGLIALLLPFVFLFVPSRKGLSYTKIPWYDFLMAALSFTIPFYFSFNVMDMQQGAWSMHPSPLNFTAALILCLLVLESSRRSGGNLFFIVCLFFGIYPLIAPFMPGMFQGPEFEFPTLIGHIAFDSEGFMGIPMQVVGGILIGFLVFSGLLIRTGAGGFFLDLAMAVAGRFRGGAAKVEVIGSAFFGSLSGSIFANIVGTGSVTIPSMIKLGYAPHRAAAIEACSSTGGVLMPPVMGAVAFVMAAMTNIPYAKIMVAAFVPSLLYYLGLIMQVDAYAAVKGLKGMPRNEIPKFWTTIKEGWHYIIVLVFLVWGLVIMRWEATTPFYASGLLLVLSIKKKKTRINSRKLLSLIEGVGKLLVDTLGIILPLGLIIAGLVVTGAAPSFTSGIIALSGGQPLIALLLGTLVCYVLGMVGMLASAYIFLAMSLAPVLVASGFNVMATHLFILYYAMLSAITPPVAAGSFLAAAIAGAPPMKTAWESMKMGVVIYIVPFFFIFEPALILQGPVLMVLLHFSTAIVGVYILAAGAEGYILKIGLIKPVTRVIGIFIGLLWIVPEWRVTAIGAGLTIPYLILLWRKTKAAKR